MTDDRLSLRRCYHEGICLETSEYSSKRVERFFNTGRCSAESAECLVQGLRRLIPERNAGGLAARLNTSEESGTQKLGALWPASNAIPVRSGSGLSNAGATDRSKAKYIVSN